MKRKIVTNIFLVMLVLMITGCGKEESPQEQKEITEYYQGEKVQLPDSTEYVCDVSKDGENVYRIVTASSQGLVWQTTDHGDSWTKLIEKPEEMKNAFLSEAVFLDDGSIFCSFYRQDNGSEGENIRASYYFITKDGEGKKVALENVGEAPDAFSGIEYHNSYVYGKSADGKVLSFDPYTGKHNATYKCSSYINSYCFIEDKIVLIGADRAQTQIIKDGTLVLDNAFVEEQLYGFVNSNAGYLPGILFLEGKLYCLTVDGIYELHIEKQEKTLLADGREQSFGNAMAWLYDFSISGNQELLVSLVDDTGESELWHYRYHPEGVKRKVLANEISLYSLEYNSMLDSEIREFNAKRGNLYVDYVFGTDGTDAVTKADAIKQLNTELLAGEGPDVILLDGLPKEAYLAKGVLADISELMTKDHLKNIAVSYQKGEKTYAIPRYFKLIGIMGDKEIVAASGDFNRMADEIEKAYVSDPEKWIFDLYFGRSYMDAIYHVYHEEFLEKDHVNEERLKEFYENVKVIGDISLKQCSDAHEVGKVKVNYSYLNIESMDWTLQAVVAKDQVLSIGGITNANDYVKMITYGSNENLSWKMFDGAGEDVIFVPTQVYAVSSNSENQGSAKELISYLISESGYGESINAEEGFPVHVSALESQFDYIQEWPDEYTARTEEVVKLQDLAITKKQKNEFVELVKSMGKSAETDSVLKEIIMEQAEKYVNGERSLEECVREACQTANIYLKE